jgi:hypothetical protein
LVPYILDNSWGSLEQELALKKWGE